MTDTPARLLGLLSLLQTPGSGRAASWPGGSASARARSAATSSGCASSATRSRPAAASRAATGWSPAPRCRRCVLDDDEAVAIAVGLRTAAGQTVPGSRRRPCGRWPSWSRSCRPGCAAGWARSARRRSPCRPAGPAVDPAQLTVFAGAITNRETVRFRYRANDGAETRRRAEPLRLVATGRRWYLVAYDLDRADWRIFRADRVRDAQATGGRIAPREAARDGPGRLRRRTALRPRADVPRGGRPGGTGGAGRAPARCRGRRADRPRRRPLPVAEPRRTPWTGSRSGCWGSGARSRSRSRRSWWRN